MNKMRDYAIAGGLVLLLLIIIICAYGPSGQAPANVTAVKKLNVVASFYPLADFAQNIGGDKIQISTIIPSGAEPHDFEPTPSSIKMLIDADVLIYNGAGLEPWLPHLLEGVDNEGLSKVDTTAGIELLAADGHRHDRGEFDPHTWLSPPIAKRQAKAIKDAFQKSDPSNSQYYGQNFAAYSEKLDALDFELKSAFSTCKRKDILITHATLSYFCKEYGCNQMAITGVNPEAEPSPAELIKIIEQAKEKNVRAVFFESLINPKSAELISKEINGYVLSFNSVHGLTDDEKERGEDYHSLMKGNIANIKKALDCN